MSDNDYQQLVGRMLENAAHPTISSDIGLEAAKNPTHRTFDWMNFVFVAWRRLLLAVGFQPTESAKYISASRSRRLNEI